MGREVSSLNKTLGELAAHLELDIAIGEPTSLIAGDVDIDEFQLSVDNW